MSTNEEIGFERSRVLHELNDLKIDLHNPAIDADKKVALALAIIDREVDLLGLNAPTKQSVELTGIQIDPLTVEIRGYVFDLPEADRIKVRDLAKSLVPPVVIDAEFFQPPKQLTEACEVPHETE